MKNLYYLPLLALLLACGKNSEKQTDYSQLSFSVDTVMVDSKEEILYLKSQLSTAVLSENRDLLYNFNNDLHSLEIIDLDNLVFLDRAVFEREGPDGTGNYIQNAHLLDDENLLLNTFQKSGVFSKKGQKSRDLNLRYTDYAGEVPQGGETLSSPLIFKSFPHYMIGTFNDYMFNSLFLGKLDLEKKSFDKKNLPEFGYLKEFFVQQIGENGYPIAIISPMIYREIAGNKIILGNTVSSDVYVYDLEKDSLSFHMIPHSLFPDRKTKNYPSKVESREQFMEVNQQFGSEINFKKPLWDEDKQVYYRFAHYNIWKEVDGKMGSPGAEVYLAVMDQDFKVLSESKLDLLEKAPQFYFLKDGKIWIFTNINDEMAFVRLSIQH